MAHDVFISYTHEDKTTADAICSHLESRGIRCWYAPRDVAPSEDTAAASLKAIEEARIMVLIFTRDANLSAQVLSEVNNAVNSRLAIIPFRLTDEEPAAGMRYYLATVHWMDAMNEELERSVIELGDLCQTVMDGKTLEPTPFSSRKDTKKSRSRLIIAAVIAALVLGIGGLSLAKLLSDSDVYFYDPDGEVVSFEGNDGEEGISIGHDPSSDENLQIGAVSENVSDDMSVTYTDGNNQNNLLNGGHLAFDGVYYYYTGNDGDRLHRMNADGSSDVTLTDIPVSCISVLDGWLYFTSDAAELFRMKTDGTELTSLVSYGADCPRILNGRIYFGEYSMESVALDGTDRREENGIDGYDILIDGTYVYYLDPRHGSHIYRAKTDGTDAVCIWDKKAANLRLAGNMLVFYDDANGWSSVYDLSTGEVYQLTNDPVNSPVITKDGIYGSSGSMKLVFVPFGKPGVKILTDGWADTVNVAGDRIFYRDSDTDKYFIMDLDGSNARKLQG
ncbi:MAG: DUF5050 domain-containing protein [Oscillospiraceae bacterium]|nr:DUF5050 domain-containing protein [Oscillospiraceae bacterium]